MTPPDPMRLGMPHERARGYGTDPDLDGVFGSRFMDGIRC